MNIPKILKTCALALVAAAAFFLTVASATAEPYDGINRIGTYYQYTSSFRTEPVYGYGYGGYGYIAPARAGGWFGSGTEWLVGLRAPVYTNVPPVRYTNYYQSVCSWPCYTGGYGYPRMQASNYPHYRGRWGSF